MGNCVTPALGNYVTFHSFAGCLPDPGHLALDAGDLSVNVTQRYIRYQDGFEVSRRRKVR